MGLGGQRHVLVTLPPGKKPGTHIKEAEWAPGPVWTCVDYLALTGIVNLVTAVSRPRREAEHSRHFSAKVKSIWSYTSSSQVYSCRSA